jgi:predicted DNA-binding transcriptional regulator AlpA
MVTRRSNKTKSDKPKPKPHGVLRRDYNVSDHPFQLFRAGRLARLLDVSPITVWRWRKDGVLPPPVWVGPGIRGWTYQQVAHLLKLQPETENAQR